MGVTVKSQIHIKCENSKAQRKTILQSTLKSAELIQSTEVLKKIRKEKHRKTIEFKKLIKDLNSLVQELEFKDLQEPTDEKVKKEVTELAKKATPKIKQVIRPATKLEHDIIDIREKLNNLKI